jgi:hypothetical protein
VYEILIGADNEAKIHVYDYYQLDNIQDTLPPYNDGVEELLPAYKKSDQVSGTQEKTIVCSYKEQVSYFALFLD